MNANELADEVESWSKIWDCNIINVTKFSKEAATMLRQQQAEIEALKEKNKELETFYRNVKARMDI